MISTTTKRLNRVEQQNEELEKDYYLVVLDYDYNNNFEYLSSIKNIGEASQKSTWPNTSERS